MKGAPAAAMRLRRPVILSTWTRIMVGTITLSRVQDVNSPESPPRRTLRMTLLNTFVPVPFISGSDSIITDLSSENCS